VIWSKLLRPLAELFKIPRALVAILLALLILAALTIEMSASSIVVAAPIIDDTNGFWSDTFSDATGLSAQNGVAVNVAQQRLEMTSSVLFSQINWHAGAGLVSTTATLTDRYADAVGVASSVTGELSLGFSLASDQDGYPDLIFSNYFSGTSGAIAADVSFVYYGSVLGYMPSARAELPALAAGGSAVADLNDDGYLDIVIARDGTVDHTHENYIYWGSSAGYSVANRDVLPGTASCCVVIADFDRDSKLDIAIGNFSDELFNFDTDSYIYWGSTGTYSSINRTRLPTIGVASAYSADFNADGYLDLVFGNYRNNGSTLLSSTFAISSYVYWGSAAGFTTTHRLDIPTIGAYGISSADLDRDGYLDLVIGNRRTGESGSAASTYQIDSYIYWGSALGFSTSDRGELPTHGTYDNSIADLNDDGYPEIIFSNH